MGMSGKDFFLPEGCCQGTCFMAVIRADGPKNMLVTIHNTNTIAVCSYEPVHNFFHDVLTFLEDCRMRSHGFNWKEIKK